MSDARSSPLPNLSVAQACFLYERSPIFKLHDDILWSIFLLNSVAHLYFVVGIEDESSSREEDVGEAALFANRRSSQVCRKWCSLIIASPSIWANSLDLRYLDQKKDSWRNEVLKRTGNAPLTLVGLLGMSIPPFLLALLDDHWERIRSLTLSSALPNSILRDKLLVIAQRPMPNLEHFFFRNAYDELPTVKFMPFLNHAPRLRSFSWDIVTFQLSGSLLSNIRHLKLMVSGFTFSFTALEVLRRLEEMTLLETLHIEQFEASFDELADETTPTITLPHLTSITIMNGVSVMIDVVTHIIGAPGCCLKVANSRMGEVDPEDIVEAYSTFFSKHFKPSDISDIRFSIWEYDYAFELTIRIRGPPGWTTECFSFDYTMGRSTRNGDIPNSMAEALSLYKMCSAIKLTFQIDEKYKHASIDDMIAFCKGLDSIRELYTDDDTLKFLSQSTDLPYLFPHLVTIHCWLWEDNLVHFLNQRHEIGLPIKFVNLAEDAPADLDNHPILNIAQSRVCRYIP